MADSEMSEKIRQLRTSQGLTLEQVAQEVGVGKSTVRKWETGLIANMRRDKIASLAKALHTTPAYLMGWEEDQTPGNADFPFLPLPHMKRWKVLGGTACGTPLYKELDDESVLAPADIDADYVFRCVGDSMINARIFDGDIVFVKAGVTVEDGQIAVVRIGEEYALKRIYRGTDYLELRSENPMYKPIIVRGEQENAEIIGLAVKFLSNVI